MDETDVGEQYKVVKPVPAKSRVRRDWKWWNTASATACTDGALTGKRKQ